VVVVNAGVHDGNEHARAGEARRVRGCGAGRLHRRREVDLLAAGHRVEADGQDRIDGLYA
jgi:hypothetical protein